MKYQTLKDDIIEAVNISKMEKRVLNLYEISVSHRKYDILNEQS